MVAAAVTWPPVCLAVAHNSDQCVSDLCGFCLFLCADISGFHDFRSVDGAQGSVVVSFMCGALFFGEKKNLRGKAVDLALVLAGMVCLWIGSAQ